MNENLLYMNIHAYNHMIQQAHQNSLQTHPDGIFDYGSEEKLRILYHKNQPISHIPTYLNPNSQVC